jgi:hypothetical protein
VILLEAKVPETPLARYGALLLVCVIAGGLAGGVSAAFGETAGMGPMIVAGSVGLAMAATLWVCARWWRSLDEAAQEAHKWAWWWGSTLGLAVAAVAIFTLVYGAPERLVGEPKELFLAGAALIGGVQTVGYGVAWAFWWLQRR